MGDTMRAFWSATAGYLAFFKFWIPYLMLSSPDASDEPLISIVGHVLVEGLAVGYTGLSVLIGIPFWLAGFLVARLAGPWLEKQKGGLALLVAGAIFGSLIGWLGSIVIPEGFERSDMPGLLAGMLAGVLAALLFHALEPKPTSEISVDAPA
ncbi:hypothetical protein [Brevundimonas sp. GCM10030266]|uniref:hypothetical protein n=1 Tax=Brevundimonas sp. GCM10030266 TaxID=3273386 RepID=UPI00361310FB